MKASSILLLFSVLSGSVVNSAAAAVDRDATHVRYTSSLSERDSDATQDLWKRKGGGKGGGTTGGSSGGSGSSSGRTSSSSNVGGATKAGSGPTPAYGRGTYYGGGGRTPYSAGRVSPVGLIAPLLLVSAASLAFWPGHWYHGCYLYPYHSPYHYYNRTSGKNETTPVVCGCSQYEVCGCDDNNNQTFIDDLVGNGSYAGLNRSVIDIGEYNGTKTLLLNGTLPNGTTAAGGTDDDDSDSDSSTSVGGSSGAATTLLLQSIGFWPVVATVVATVFMI